MSVIFLNSGSSDARAMILSLFGKFSGSRVSNKYNSTLTIERDFVYQGHVNLSVTFLITGSRDARSMIFHGRNQLNKENHSTSFTGTGDQRGRVQCHVTLTNKVTRDSYCVELDIFDIRDPKNLQNKRKIIALASLEQEIRKVTLMVT